MRTAHDDGSSLKNIIEVRPLSTRCVSQTTRIRTTVWTVRTYPLHKQRYLHHRALQWGITLHHSSLCRSLVQTFDKCVSASQQADFPMPLIGAFHVERGRTGNISCPLRHCFASITSVAPAAGFSISCTCFREKTSDVSSRLSWPPSATYLL